MVSRLDHKTENVSASTLLSLGCEDAQAAFGSGPHGRELRPPANSQHQLASSMEAYPSAPVKLSDVCSPANIPTAAS